MPRTSQPGDTVGLHDNIRALQRGELRTIGGLPFMPWLNPLWRFDIGGPVHPSHQIMGTERSLGLPALYSSVKILSDMAASVPIRVYTKQNGATQLYTGPSLFDKPSLVGTRFDWIFAGMSSLLLHGNAWGFITSKDSYGFPRGIEWLPPERMYVQEDQRSQGLNPANAKVFFDGREMKWFGPDAELFHVRAFTQAGQIEGISPMRKFAQVIMSGQLMQEYGDTWFRAGGFPVGIFKNAELEVDPDQSAKIRTMMTAILRKREPLVLGRDWDYTPVTVPPSEAQFIDAMQLNATQIAAIYNVPPDRVGGKRGDSLTYNTVEQGTLQIIEALHPWLRRFEDAFDDILPNRRYVRFWTDALLRTDLEARTNMYAIQRRIGLRSIDEIREELDMPPLPGDIGNEHLPLDLMVSMATRAGAVPKSLNPEIDYLMDHAAETLTKLQKKGIAQQNPVDPNTGQPVPPAESPSTVLAGMITAYARSHPESAGDERIVFLRDLTDRMLAIEDPEHRNGAWLRNPRGIIPG